jgi:tRNA-specific 2-thiouridylase
MGKALIAMSGGVDSSVAAYLMQQKGFTCGGAIMQLWKEVSSGAIADAQAVADRLGMDFYILDASEDFRQQVVEYFIRSYEKGLTPNPCIQCNRHLKFSFFLERALEFGYDTIATGHYATVRKDPNTGRFLLCKAVDSAKDQSYFLACLNQHQLSHVCFPLGELTKEEARTIAESQGFVNARKKDSQDICFVPDGDYVAFMKQYTGKDYPNGDYLDLNGNVVGKHCGAVCYTLGQRKGLGIALGAPVYVCSKDMEANTVTVGPESALFATTLLADSWNWFPFETLTEPIRVMAKARYRHSPQPATVYPMEDGSAKVVFDAPQRAMTPGQTVALYDGDIVVGGGIITEVL